MKRLKSAEFAQFSFVRDANGSVIELPSHAIDERILLVIDGERWGLSRLHIFEDVARRQDALEAFEAEMKVVSKLWGDSVSRVTAWGRDSDELFYADEMLNGEGLPDYLGRTGSVPVATVAEWMVQLIEVLDAAPPGLPTFERFSTQNFQVVVDRFDQVRLTFSEFEGWMRPGLQVHEHGREWYLAQIFCSLFGGVPVRTFHSNSLPRNFEELEAPVKNAVLDALVDGRPGADEEFCAVMRSLAVEGQIGESRLAMPRMPVREWLTRDLAKLEIGVELNEEIHSEGNLYAVPAEIRGVPSLLQILPGPNALPREGWLNQHHEVTRRPGRVKLNQLQVNQIRDEGSLTIVGEEHIKGANLSELIEELGPLSLGEAVQLSDRLSAVLTMLECQVGSHAVWWLPPENVIFETGTHAKAAAGRYFRRQGPSVWQEVPVKLRLHQTMNTLLQGVDLPSQLRSLSCQPGKKHEATRRSAVALPLIWHAMTRRRLKWDVELHQQDPGNPALPDQIVNLLEEFRLELVERPIEIEVDLFTRLQREMSGVELKHPGDDEEADAEDELESMLDSVLYPGEVSLEEK